MEKIKKLVFGKFYLDKDLRDSIADKKVKTLAQLVGKLKGTLVRLGPDTLNLMNYETPRGKTEPKDNLNNTEKNVSGSDLEKLGITGEEFEALKTAFTDPAKLANILKKLAQAPPYKLASMLDKMFDTIHEKTAETMFNLMVDNNPVFSDTEKADLKKNFSEAKTKTDKKKFWQDQTSGKTAREAHAKKTKAEKDKIFEEQVNQNPRYGSPGEDTQERRERFKEYTQADDTQKEKMQGGENTRFTSGQNASEWAHYFQDNANFQAGAGDESVGTESDNNFQGNFSFTDSLAAINKLKNIGSVKPPGMEEGMKSNKPYWEVVFAHPLTYIFLFIGLIVAVLAAAVRKNK